MRTPRAAHNFSRLPGTFRRAPRLFPQSLHQEPPMRLSRTLRAAGATVTLCAALLLTAHGEHAAPPRKPIDLGGPDRYLTYVSTDKPIYRPGEKLYVRASILHAVKHTPSTDGAVAMVEVIGPKGDV